MNHQKRRLIVALLLITGICAIFIATPVRAQGFNILSVVSDSCRSCGACSLCDLMSVVTKTMRFLLSLSGALGLALFIWGGWTLMLSGGKAEEVEHGKKVVSGTVVGLAIIILLAWVWPTWVIMALKGVPEDKKPPTIFTGGDQWWLTPCQKAQGLTRSCEEADWARRTEEERTLAECTVLNENGLTVFKPAGSECKGCEPQGSFCVCDERKECKKACITSDECLDKGMDVTFCLKQGGLQGGYCTKIEPGMECPADGSCPKVYTVPPNTPGVTGGRGVLSEMYCERITGVARCYIKSGQDCRRFTIDGCGPRGYCNYNLTVPLCVQ